MSAIYFGAKYIERHITILEKDMTRDGKVSIKPEDIMLIKKFSKLSKKDQLLYLKKKFQFSLNKLKGKKIRKLSDSEKLNRDYYRGRFASKDKNGNIIYNWEETDLSKLV